MSNLPSNFQFSFVPDNSRWEGLGKQPRSQKLTTIGLQEQWNYSQLVMWGSTDGWMR